MSDQVENKLTIDHVSHSVGGFKGHAFRRLTHISMFLIPVLYYKNGIEISSFFNLDSIFYTLTAKYQIEISIQFCFVSLYKITRPDITTTTFIRFQIS